MPRQLLSLPDKLKLIDWLRMKGKSLDDLTRNEVIKMAKTDTGLNIQPWTFKKVIKDIGLDVKFKVKRMYSGRITRNDHITRSEVLVAHLYKRLGELFPEELCNSK